MFNLNADAAAAPGAAGDAAAADLNLEDRLPESPAAGAPPAGASPAGSVPLTAAAVAATAIPHALQNAPPALAAAVGAVPFNVATWAQQQGAAFVTEMAADLKADPETLARVQQMLANLALAGIAMIGQNDPATLAMLKEERDGYLSALEDLGVVAIRSGELSAAKATAKLFADSLDMVLSGIVKVV